MLFECVAFHFLLLFQRIDQTKADTLVKTATINTINYEVTNRCHLPPAVGYGKQTMRRFYYDWKTDGCHELQYSGIGGNENSFITYEKCEAVCRGAGEPPISLPSNLKISTKDKKIPIEKQGSVKQTPGPPIGANLPITSWATFPTADITSQPIQIQTSTIKSKEIYPAIQAQATTAKPIIPSSSSSENRVLSSHQKSNSVPTEPVPFASNPCSLPPDKGKPGGVARKLFYFDMSSLSCVLFTYLGNGGNSNRFESAAVCSRVCGIGKPTRRSCDLPAAAGSGPFKIPRYYFDSSTKACQRFYYTGKDGNDNRFHKKHKCERLCLGKRPKTTTKDNYHHGYNYETSTSTSTETFTRPTMSVAFTVPPTTTDRIIQQLVSQSTVSQILEMSTVDLQPEIFGAPENGNQGGPIGAIYTGNSYEETPPPLPRPPIQPSISPVSSQEFPNSNSIYPQQPIASSSNFFKPYSSSEQLTTTTQAAVTSAPMFNWNQMVTVPPFEELPTGETSSEMPFPTLIYEPRGEQLPRMTPPSSYPNPPTATFPPYLLPNQTPPNIDQVFSRLISNQENFIAPLLGLSTPQPLPNPEPESQPQELLPYLPQIMENKNIQQQQQGSQIAPINNSQSVPSAPSVPLMPHPVGISSPNSQPQQPQMIIPQPPSSNGKLPSLRQPYIPLPNLPSPSQPVLSTSNGNQVPNLGQLPTFVFPPPSSQQASFERTGSSQEINGSSQNQQLNIMGSLPASSFPTLVGPEPAITNDIDQQQQPVSNVTFASYENSPCSIPLVGDATILCADGKVQCSVNTFCQIGEGQSICCPISDQPPCQQSLQEGIGTSSIGRWYFDSSSSLCLPFIFKGFKGNQNNFVSYEACRRACGGRTVCANGDPLMPEPANIDCATGSSTCSLDYSCTAIGAGHSLCCPTTPQLSSAAVAVVSNASPCEQLIDSGFGSDSHHRWAYDGGQCVSFLYKGHGGNQNNFLTRQDCESICKGHPSIPVRCNHPAASGHGSEYLMRYFYSQEYHQCLHFIYSGEGGNENNFMNLAECLETCVANGVRFNSLAFNPSIQTSTFSFTFLPSRICPQGDPITMENGQPLQCDWRRNAKCPGETVCSPVGETGFCCPSPMSYCLQSRPPISVCNAPNFQPVQEIRFTYDPLADKCVRFSYANCSPQIQAEASLNMFSSNSQFSVILNSISANRIPTQFLGPTPNGIHLREPFSFQPKKRSGMNFSGSLQLSGSICTA
ncbi:hypothetical protein WR25_17324 [Diploscapter pachys]|uniref:BPTI/Kunitz inhibitor domain-containing protein n=1 Tax=Diploscapter pachys TaxID=2018661 RepID=A0A2A2JN50_9BILA|nr:hypothetical protein WR25_17324 [Diploscapter pachys]